MANDEREERAGSLVPRANVVVRRVESCIYLIRGEGVMLDSDLADLYGVPTGALNRAVGRNRGRFPPGLHVPAQQARVRRLEVPDWHLK